MDKNTLKIIQMEYSFLDDMAERYYERIKNGGSNCTEIFNQIKNLLKLLKNYAESENKDLPIQ